MRPVVRSRPGRGVGHGLGQRPAVQAAGQRTADVHRVQAGVAARHPQRQLGPRADTLRQQEGFVDPVQPGVGLHIGPQRVAQRLQQRAHRQRRGRPGEVEGAGAAAFGLQQQPGREVAGVDALHGVGGCAGHQHVAATRQALHPPGEAPAGVVRPDDQPRPRHQALARQRGGQRLLAQRLQAAVAAAVDGFGGGVGQHLQRGVFARAGFGKPGVDADARHQQVALDPPRQALRQAAHLARHVGAGVDDHVPAALRQRGEVAVAVGDAVLGLREQPGPAAAAVQQRHRVPGGQGLVDDVAPEETGSADDETTHARHAKRRPRCRLSGA